MKEIMEKPDRVDMEILIERARNGDREAFQLVVAGCTGQLTEHVRSRLGTHLQSSIEPDDVVQETYARALRSIAEFRGRDEATVYSWLKSIAEHVILESARGAARECTPRGRTLQLNRDMTTRDIAGKNVSPSKLLRRGERFQRLQKALSHLSPDHQEVIRLARIDGLRIQEISQRMERSPDAVKQLLSRALKKLKETFGDTESLHLPRESLFRQNSGEE